MDLEEIRLERLRKWSRGESEGPVSLHLFPTDYCNLNCSYCWRPSAVEAGDITPKDRIAADRIKKLIKSSKKMGAVKITVSGGGEPLMHPQLTEQLELIKKLGMEGELITNGTAFSPEVVRRVVNSGWDRIQFSIDGPKETHDKLRGVKGAWDRSFKIIDAFQEVKSARQQERPKLGLSITVCKDNYKDLELMMKLADKHGCENVSCEPVLPINQGAKSLTLTQQEQVRKHVERAKQVSEELGVKSNVENVLANLDETDRQSNKTTSKNVPHCYEPWHHLVIQPDGSVGPCCLSHDDPANIYQSSLREIWFEGYFKQIRRKFSRGEQLSYCDNCSVWIEKENKRLGSEIGRVRN